MRFLSVLAVCASISWGAQSAQNLTQPTTVNFASTLPQSGNLVLGVYSDGQLGRFGKTIEQNTQGGLSHAIKMSGFDAKVLSTKAIAAPMGSKYQQILLVGLGERSQQLSALQWQKIGGNAVQKAVKAFKSAPAMAFDIDQNSLANVAYGAKLGGYYFDRYFTGADSHKHLDRLTVIGQNAAAADQYYDAELEPLANAIHYTRDVSNEPANVIYPQSFVERWREHFKGMDNITIKVIDEKQMLKLGMGAIYGVGRGSKRPPRMMIVEYQGSNKGDAPLMFVGKGITFDTGGISLKNPKNMWDMKFDMSGAASAMGTAYALAGRKAKVNVVAIAALAENMPGGNAQRPGDVVTSMSGKTIQIRSTDAEGRLVLADGLYYGDITYNPKLLVNLATLTGSASRALGEDYAALFSRHDDLVEKLEKVSLSAGEGVWHLPLNDNHFKAIKNTVADVMNSGGNAAPGASAGAAFLGTFVRPQTYWAHLDIAGISDSDKPTPTKGSPGSRGYGIRLLNELVRQYYE